MSYSVSLDEIDGCLIVTDGKHTVKVERFATDGIREVYGRTVELLDRENAKMREELAKARDPQRIGGQADPSSFVYAIEQLREFRWQHATNDEDAIPYINNVAAAHERENAKLRERIAELEELLPENGRWFGAEVVEAYVAEIKKLRKELKDVLSLLRLGARSGEGISREWCRERLDYYSDRMRELGIEVPDE